MGERTDYDRPDRPSTAQPPPVHVPGAASVHDLIVRDLVGRLGPSFVGEVEELLTERRDFGLRKYGTTLQVEDPARDASQDLLEELADALCYAYRARALGVPGGSHAYEVLLSLTTSAASWWYRPPRDGG